MSSNAPTLTAQYIGFVSTATPPTPPGGVIYTFMDSTGVLKQINDQAVVSAFGGGGGGFPSTATAITKDNTGTPSGNIPLSGLGGPALLKFAANGTPSAAVGGTDYALAPALTDDIIVAGSDVQDLPIAPTVWTLNGDTDGDYEMWGDIIVPAASGGTAYGLQINADTSVSNYLGAEFFGGTGVGITSAALTGPGYLNLSTGLAQAGHMTFYAKLQSKSGRIRQFHCWLVQYDPTTPSFRKIDSTMVYIATGTVIGPTTRIHASVAASIKAGSYVRIRRQLNAT